MPRPGEDRSDVGGAAQFNNIVRPVPLPDSSLTISDLSRFPSLISDLSRFPSRFPSPASRPGITNYLLNGGPLEKAQKMANHESAKTTKLYDRRDDDLTLDEVERITI